MNDQTIADAITLLNVLAKTRAQLVPAGNTKGTASLVLSSQNALLPIPLAFPRGISDSAATDQSVATQLNTLVGYFNGVFTRAGAMVSSLLVRSRTGTATLCGFSEYTSPSTPPKKYRRQTISGDWRNCDWNNADGGCIGGADNRDTEVYSGTYTYSPTTCATTNAQVSNYYADGTDDQACASAMPFVSSGTPAANFVPSFLPAGHYTLTTAPTSNSWVYDATCYNLGGGNGYRTISGTITATLDDEDTLVDAIARATPSSWTAFTNNFAATIASIEVRGAGDFTSAYTEVEAEVVVAGLTIGQSYDVEIYTETRIAGSSDPWVVGPTTVISFTAGAVTETLNATLYCGDGMEVRATGAATVA